MSANGDMTENSTKPAGSVGIREVAQEALHHLDQGVSIYDADLNLTLFNEHFIELLEFPKEMVRHGTRFEDLIRYNARRGEYGPGDEDQQVRERVAKARNPTHHSYRRTRPDGTVIQVDGNPLPSGGFIATYTDITEKVRAEAFLRNIVEATPAGFIVTRQKDGQIAFGNNRAAALHGYTLNELIALRGRDLYADPMERQILLDRCLADDDVENIEATLVRKDGAAFPGLITLRLSEFQGTPCFFGWIIDVSQQKAAWQNGKDKDERMPADINRLLLKVVEDTRSRWSQIANVTVETDNDLPKLVCNPKELSKALEVLLLNSTDMAAAKQSGPNTGEQSLARIRLTARNHQDGMRITITDDGVPLNPATMGSVLKGTMGPGAELDICVDKIIKEMHGGAIATEHGNNGNTVVLLMPTDA